MISTSSIISLLIWFIPIIINGQSIFTPTVSNATGDYYISQNTSNETLLMDGEIICSVGTLCSIQCIHHNSCKNTIIRCGNAAQCDIKCIGEANDDWFSDKGENVCKYATIYTSTIDTSITCDGSGFCDYMTMYTDYTNYPNSYTELACSGSSSCDSFQILDSNTPTSSGYTNAEQFKIFCVDAWLGCEFPYDQLHSDISYPLITPTVSNSSGEYYYNIGSFMTISCSNNDLCYIDCAGGGCHYSTITCDNVQNCIIKCNGDGWDECEDININVNDGTSFIWECMSDEFGACRDATVEITNVDTVDIRCVESAFSCNDVVYNIENVPDLNIICDGHGICDDSLFNIDNTDSMTVLCDYASDGFEACEELTISATNTEMIDIECLGGDDCPELNICSDGSVNIDCSGTNSCFGGTFCDDITALYRNCTGENSCITEAPTTASPTPSPVPTRQPVYGVSESDMKFVAFAVLLFPMVVMMNNI